jgi:hypothetical protein
VRPCHSLSGSEQVQAAPRGTRPLTATAEQSPRKLAGEWGRLRCSVSRGEGDEGENGVTQKFQPVKPLARGCV